MLQGSTVYQTLRTAALVCMMSYTLCMVAVTQADFCTSDQGYNATFCGPDATCCKYNWSPNGFGCCAMPNAVCCEGGYTCCPTGTECVNSGSSWSITTQCVNSTTKTAVATGQQICKIGPQVPFKAEKKKVLIVGDSVSIGYTPYVASQLADIADVLHSPAGGDGGACETAYGIQCFEQFTTSSSGHALSPDLIFFNWGLHDTVPANGSAVPGQSGYISDYLPQLSQLVEKFLQKGTQLMFAITSPQLCDASLDGQVQYINGEAEQLMAMHQIPTVNLHQAIVNKCGAAPQQECFGLKGCWCPHCPPGYSWLANSTISPAIRQLLTKN
eukprot:m.9769 g.9769  ORF g.9769 m.9769 type:complete len:328 (-) comp5491_c0_seq1:3512-4495(-)